MPAATVPAADAPGTAYEDRVIAAGSLPLDQEDQAESTDTSGLPRALRVETGVADTSYGSASRNEAAVSASGYWDTLSWGAWSVDGVLRSGDRSLGGEGSSFTLWQRRMPFADGWFADNALGVVNTPAVPLMRGGYRFSLPMTVIAGVQTDWSQRGGVEFQAAAGEPGYFLGGHWPGFRDTGGQYAQLDAQWPWSATAAGAIAVIDEHNVQPWSLNNVLGLPASGSRIDAKSLYAASSWQTDLGTLQANLLVGKSGDDSTRAGGWIDAQTNFDAFRQHYGVFRLDPGLSWGVLPFSNDIEGGYYRIDYQRAEWSWTGGIDSVRSISGNGVDGNYLTGALRYQARPWLAVGGDATVKAGDHSAYSGSVYLDWRTDFGESRLQLQQAKDGEGRQSSQLTLNHAFPTGEGTAFSLAASAASVDSVLGGTTKSESLAAIGSYALGNSISLDGNLRWTRGQGPDGQQGLDGNVSLNWKLSRGWSLAATYYRSEATRRSVFVIDPIAQSTPFVSLPGTRAYSMLLRYEWRAGSPAGVLGSAAGGVGAVSGTIFLDDNNNGRRDAGEATVPNVTVIIDGRYSTRTNASGRFEFPGVGGGEHVVTVLSDSLPLPWAFDERSAQTTIRVKPRGEVRLEIGARRQ